MTEACSQPLPLISDAFNDFPYCRPGIAHENAIDILSTYAPQQVASDPKVRQYFCEAYDTDKAGSDRSGNPAEKSEPIAPALDLRDPDHLQNMISHTLIHAVTGDIDMGTSSTRSIPYWDREAVEEGLQFQDPENAAARLEIVDALSMNALRAHCFYALSRAEHHQESLLLISRGIDRGKTSMLDMLDEQLDRLLHHGEEFEGTVQLLAAKLKHLLFLVDVQVDPAIRKYMRTEVHQLLGLTASQVRPSELAVDMGRDAGISASSDRPPYDISMFMQLAHIDPGATERIYALPQEACDVLSLRGMIASICREGRTKPSYQDGRYRLPWQFDSHVSH